MVICRAYEKGFRVWRIFDILSHFLVFLQLTTKDHCFIYLFVYFFFILINNEKKKKERKKFKPTHIKECLKRKNSHMSIIFLLFGNCPTFHIIFHLLNKYNTFKCFVFFCLSHTHSLTQYFFDTKVNQLNFDKNWSCQQMRQHFCLPLPLFFGNTKKLTQNLREKNQKKKKVLFCNVKCKRELKKAPKLSQGFLLSLCN